MLRLCRSDTPCIVGHPVLDEKHDQILTRSPDLNVLDYAIWAEVEKRLRKQERNMPDAKHETRQAEVKYQQGIQAKGYITHST